ncbi:eukaryotic translation initiation factor 4B isoform X2 [Rhipicephalus sanguineus]|uniref:eukaryotic translation initiation factor 4B isoform X2 n=1 Tax=Rhipicephalus sanguineus TaxID=34632 RepID=UPI001895F64B|nr:eukaryotic translation initiation factor 4B isoform X2 [Rhipicephalus sanguineus]
MSRVGGKKHKVKGKTLNLNDFLGGDQEAPSGYAVVNTRRINWADTMENEAVDEKFTMDYKRDEKIILPTAPKAARGPDVDLSKVPNRPPYTVYLGNLPYDVCDEDVIKFFRGLKVSSVRLPRESGDRGRMRGFGYAEFPDRSTLLEALGYNNENLKSRSIKVSLAEEHDNEGRERGNRDIGRSDRSLGGDWRAMSRDDGDDDRRESSSFGGSRGYDDDGGYRRPGFGRDSDRDGGDFGRDRFSRDRPRGFGDRDQGFDRGFERRGGGLGGYDRPRDRDYDRDRGFGGGGRREYGSSFRDDRDDRFSRDDRDDRDQDKPGDSSGFADSAPRERKKLQLKPRSVPVEATKEAAAVPKAPEPAPKASSAIFGGARPVDTAAREREIEARLARQREEEERRQIRDREPFQDSRKDDRVRRSSVGSGSGRSRRSSESGRDSYDDGGRQPLSRQYSNDSDQHSQSSRHGSQAGYDAPVRGEPGDSAKRPPADRIRRPDSGGSGPRDGPATRNGGERPPSKQELTSGPKSDDGKEVVYTSRNIYAHLQQEDGDEVSD